MRTLVGAALLVAACAPGEKPRGAAAGPAQKYAGTFEGRSYRSASDTGTPFRIIAAVGSDGTLRGTLWFTDVAAPAPPIPVRARQVSDTGLVDEIGPYHSPTANRDVVTTTTGKLRGDSLNGTFEMRPPGGGTVILRGAFRSKRVAP
jgi:hypothetical protein